MDENFQSYNNHWLQYNNYHQDPINGLLEIPFSEQISNAITADHDQFFMDPPYVDVSRFRSTDHGESIPKEGPNSTTAAFMEEDPGGSRKESGGGKPVKRRSRASRRTPPTVLNASVKNFRDLVQQYTGCESSGNKNQKGPINLSFGSSSSDHHPHHHPQQIDHFPGFDGRSYDHQNYHEQQQTYQEYDHVQGFM